MTSAATTPASPPSANPSQPPTPPPPAPAEVRALPPGAIEAGLKSKNPTVAILSALALGLGVWATAAPLLGGPGGAGVTEEQCAETARREIAEALKVHAATGHPSAATRHETDARLTRIEAMQDKFDAKLDRALMELYKRPAGE